MAKSVMTVTYDTEGIMKEVEEILNLTEQLRNKIFDLHVNAGKIGLEKAPENTGTDH